MPIKNLENPSLLPVRRYSEKSQDGNVLFLILIAVALFAALSYVVVQSSRSGSGTTSREKNLLTASGVTQYPTALRTAAMRMNLAGVSPDEMKFDLPGTAGFTAASVSTLVFHPQGGGALNKTQSRETGITLTWYYNANYYVPGVGLDPSTNSDGNDLIAFLPGVSNEVCQQINEGLKVDLSTCSTVSNSIPVAAAMNYTGLAESLDSTHSYPTTAGNVVQCDGGTAFDHQAAACFQDGSGTNYFYAVLLEQ